MLKITRRITWRLNCLLGKCVRSVVFHTSQIIHVHPNRGCVVTLSTEESDCVIHQFSLKKSDFTNWGSSGWGRLPLVKLGGIMCVKHAGVQYQHYFASQFIAGGQRRKSIFCTFRRYPERWKRKLARVEILPVSLFADHLHVASDLTPGYRLLVLLGHALGEGNECGRAGRHNCVYRVKCSMGCILISRDRSEGRCWQRSVDRLWRVVGSTQGNAEGGIEGWGWFADLVLAVTEEKQTDLTVTNEPSPVPPLTVSSLSDSFTHLQSHATFPEPSPHLFPSLSPWSLTFSKTLLFNFAF